MKRLPVLWVSIMLIVFSAGIYVYYTVHSINRLWGARMIHGARHNHNRAIHQSTITILIQPFEDMDSNLVSEVEGDIIKVYPYVTLKPAVPLPASAWYQPRSRYKADTIIHWLSARTGDGFVSIGLTSKDISTTKDNISDWGVMGLGLTPGNACVVSTFRLNKTNLKEQLYKVCLHELGHTQGLDHCNVKTCFMRDAEGHNPTDEEISFCPSCKKKLVDKGWKL